MKSQSKDIEIVPLGKEHLEPAAALVADRYREGRVLNPLFPERYENPAAVLPLLRFRAEEQLGVAAVRDGKTWGFMLSFPFSSWGIPAVWIPDCGHGAEKTDRGYTYRRMYAALRDLSLVPQMSVTIEIRQAGPEDFDTLMNYRELMCRHLTASPVFLFIPGEAREIGAKELRQQLSDNNAAIWLACEQGKVIGFMRVVPSSQCDYRMPTFDRDICGISMAFTDGILRQKGVAAALLNRVLVWAREKGYAKCAVDFESANIPGSRFWLKHFQPACHTLMRYIDSRIYGCRMGGG